MRKLCHWFWPPLALLLLAAGLVVLGGLVVTHDIPLTTAAWRQHATRNAHKRATQPTTITDIDAGALARAQASGSRLQRQYGMGELRIPAANIDLTIYSVVTNATLATGVARYFPTRAMGQGNNVYAAHNMAGAHVLLSDINTLATGARITQTDFTHVYTYRVIYNRVVKMTETPVLDQTSERRITLIRCEGPAHSRYRRVVIGRLTKVSRFHAARTPDAQPLLRAGQTLTGTLARQTVNRPLILALVAGFLVLLARAWRGYYRDR